MKKMLFVLLLAIPLVFASMDYSGFLSGSNQDFRLFFDNATSQFSSGICWITIFNPSNTVVTRASMTYVSDAMFKYTWAVPASPYGDWSARANCTDPGTGQNATYTYGFFVVPVMASNYSATINSSVYNTSAWLAANLSTIQTNFTGVYNRINSTVNSTRANLMAETGSISNGIWANASWAEQQISGNIESAERRLFRNMTALNATVNSTYDKLNASINSSYLNIMNALGGNFTIINRSLSVTISNLSYVINSTSILVENASYLRKYDLFEIYNWSITSFGGGSDAAGHGPQYAIDNDYSTWWERGGGIGINVEAGLEIDFGTVLPVSRIGWLINGNNDVSYVTFERSYDNVNWYLMYNISRDPLTVLPRTYFDLLFYNTTARYIRFRTARWDGASTITANEWDVFIPNAAISYYIGNRTDNNLTRYYGSLNSSINSSAAAVDFTSNFSYWGNSLNSSINSSAIDFSALLAGYYGSLNNSVNSTQINVTFNGTVNFTAIVNVTANNTIVDLAPLQKSMDTNFEDLRRLLRDILDFLEEKLKWTIGFNVWT